MHQTHDTLSQFVLFVGRPTRKRIWFAAQAARQFKFTIANTFRLLFDAKEAHCIEGGGGGDEENPGLGISLY
jgi:hypothetical protein